MQKINNTSGLGCTPVERNYDYRSRVKNPGLVPRNTRGSAQTGVGRGTAGGSDAGGSSTTGTGRGSPANRPTTMRPVGLVANQGGSGSGPGNRPGGSGSGGTGRRLLGIPGLHDIAFEVDDMPLDEDHKAFMYAGLNLHGMFEEVEKKYNSLRDVHRDLMIVNSVTFLRGFSYNKIQKNMSDPSKVSKLVTAMNNLGISNVDKPGPKVITLGRASLLLPISHPDFIHQGHQPESRGLLKGIPKVANCGSFVSCIPKDPKYDPLFHAGVVFNVYWDTVITTKGQGAIVKTIFGFNKASREGSVLREETQKKYLIKWGIDSDAEIIKYNWIRPVLENVMDSPSKLAWGVLKQYAELQQNAFKFHIMY